MLKACVANNNMPGSSETISTVLAEVSKEVFTESDEEIKNRLEIPDKNLAPETKEIALLDLHTVPANNEQARI